MKIKEFQKLIESKKGGARTKYCLKYLSGNTDNELMDVCIDALIKGGYSKDQCTIHLISQFLSGTLKSKECPICYKVHLLHGLTCSPECRRLLHNKTCKDTCIEKYGVENVFQVQEYKNKYKETCIEKYGVENVSQIQDVKLKKEQTCLKHFGAKCSFMSDECREKTKRTLLEKYGVENVSCSDVIKHKKELTTLLHWGVENPFQSEEVKDKIKHTNLKNLGVEYPTQSREVQEKSKETCLKKYAVEYISQSNEFRKHLKELSLKKYGVSHPMKSEKLKHEIRKRYEKRFVSNICNYTNKNINKAYLESFIFKKFDNDYFDIAKCVNDLNVKPKTINTLKKIFNIDIPNYYSNGISNQERELFNWIPCNNKVSNDRKVITPYELDIVLPNYNLAIEYNGVYWHSDFYKDENYHLEKTLKCNNKGIQLFHIFESDDIDIWKSMISNKLHLNTKIYARKCTVKEITNSIAKSFCTQNHLQGACNAKINLGLFYNDELLEVMTFGKPRYNKHYEFELLRLCTKKYYSVIGGASKLWKCFCQKYSPKSVISYANRRFSNGNIYETLGFKFLNDTKPNYWYVKGGELFSRLKFQKHKLKDILENYDENLSESENMQLNNYHRIFDCGNLVYSFKTNT